MENIEKLVVTLFNDPFPHMICKNFYNPKELELIWEELKFYTKPGKLLEAKDYGGVVGYTNAKALMLDSIYRDYGNNDDVNYRNISNILTVNRKLFTSGVLDAFSKIHDCCSIANESNNDTTKIRYYHDGEYYEPHTDKGFQFLGFSYFYKEPKKFTGGQFYFHKIIIADCASFTVCQRIGCCCAGSRHQPATT